MQLKSLKRNGVRTLHLILTYFYVYFTPNDLNIAAIVRLEILAEFTAKLYLNTY